MTSGTPVGDEHEGVNLRRVTDASASHERGSDMLAEIFGVDGIVVLAVVLAVLFGGSQIPRLARSLGSAKREFKAGLDEPATSTTPGAHADDRSVA